MVMAALLAVVVANSSAYEIVHELLEARLSLSMGPLAIGLSLEAFVNDFLMAIFFLMVGLEIKREVLAGGLSTWGQRALPGFGALGGMVVPALIYIAINWGNSETLKGWAIPAATDIAFAVGILALVFVVFDVESIFLFPWATVFKTLSKPRQRGCQRNA